MSLMVRLAVISGLLCSSAEAQTSQGVKAVVDELAPGVHPGRSFVEAYAAVIAPQLTNLDEFAAFLSTNQTQICNLLCQKHVTGAFFKGDARGPGDLIRYVFTATCYGIIPSMRHRGLALADLETVLGNQTWYRDSRNLSEYDKLVIRDVLGDALKDYLGQNYLGTKPNVPPVAKANFGRVVALWRAAYRKGAPRISDLPMMWSESQDQAALTACKGSGIEKLNPL
jgi:hypothetical protein